MYLPATIISYLPILLEISMLCLVVYLLSFYRNSKSSQDVVDFINCRISEKSNGGPPTADDLVSVCKSVGF